MGTENGDSDRLTISGENSKNIALKFKLLPIFQRVLTADAGQHRGLVWLPVAGAADANVRSHN